MKRAVYPLYAPADESRVKPILDALEAKGVTVRTADPRKGDALVLFLSEAVKADSPAVDEFFRLNAGRELVIPVNLDGSTPPEELQNALMARHAIFAQRYAPAELAELIRKALPEKRPLPLILALLGAAAFLAVGAILLFRQRQTPPPPAPPATEVPATPAPTATAAPEVAMPDFGVDVSKIAEVVYVGNAFHFYKMNEGYHLGTDGGERSYNEVAYDVWDNGGPRFYSTENGQLIPMGEMGDVEYLRYLPNLMFLTLVNVEGELPDLSGLKHLRRVTIVNCRIPDIRGLGGSQINWFEYHGDTVTDFSPLNDCSKLTEVSIAPWNDPAGAMLADFHPAPLQRLNISGKVTDLSGLSQCTRLKWLDLRDAYLEDLSYLAGLSLQELWFDVMPRLTNLAGLQGMETLRRLEIHGCSRLADISALAGCNSLSNIHIDTDGDGRWMDNLRDVSVLGTLPKLQDIGLYGVRTYDLNFLKEMKLKGGVNLGFSIGQGADLSGLAAINSYNYLHVNTQGNYAAAAPYLQGKTVQQLMIYNGGLVDLSTLPNVTGELDLCDCLNRDLTDIRELKFSGKLWIQDCPYFTSFDGIENLTGIGTTGSILTVEGCPRLTDWSGVEGKRFDRLELKGVFTLPDLSKITFTSLALEYLEEDVLPDLTCLNGINENRRYNFRFVGMDQITDLSPLFRLKGYTLEVPPQVGEQAKGLVEDKRFKKYEIVYPDGGWDPSDVQVQLLSLEELETLPPSLLKHVKRLTIIGDELVNDDTTNFWADWGQQNVPAFVEDRATGEQKKIDRPGTRITDLSKLSVLTGLEELVLWWQPLTSLEGVQALENLQRLRVMFSPNLTDVSAAFALQGLKEINFERCPVASLQGVQNLYDLEMLEVCNTKITSLEGIEGLKHLRQVRVAGTNIRDFSPLGQVDFTYAMTQDWEPGVSLALNVMNSNSLPQDAYAFLEGIPGFSQLEFPSVSAKLWLDHLAGKPVKRLNADDCGFTNEQFRAFVEAHPELEEVQISWNQQLTDVSCLLALENLRKVQLSSNMTQAKASLGAGYGFELKLD